MHILIWRGSSLACWYLRCWWLARSMALLSYVQCTEADQERQLKRQLRSVIAWASRKRESQVFGDNGQGGVLSIAAPKGTMPCNIRSWFSQWAHHFVRQSLNFQVSGLLYTLENSWGPEELLFEWVLSMDIYYIWNESWNTFKYLFNVFQSGHNKPTSC